MTNQFHFLVAKRIFGLLILCLSLQACQQNSGGGGSDSASNASPSQVTCSASLDPSSYFEDVASSTDLPGSAQDKSEPAVLRTRMVRVNIEAMKADMKAGHASMKLDLFHDKNMMVTVERIQEFSKDNYVVTGRIADDPLSSVSLALNQDVLIANINQSTGPRYNISYKGNGTHSIQETSAQDVDNDESSCLATAAPAPTAEDVTSSPPADPSTKALAATPVIDMLVAYTPNAKAKVGGDAAMIALIQSGMADTNKAFVDSGVNLQARLVGTMLVAQNETGNWSSDLSALSGKTDGLWDEVHAERARLGADQVTMVGVYPNDTVAGIGFIKSTSSSAFTVTKVSAFPNYSFTHELGHNVGLNHSDGYVNSNGSFRTIMAYGSVVRILHFSNPNIPYKNYATGTSSNNSAAILNANGATTAAFAASKVAVTTPDIPVVPGTGPSSNCN
jgi:hypothetical protein